MYNGIQAAANGTIFYSTNSLGNTQQLQLWRTDSTGLTLKIASNIYGDFDISNNICLFSNNDYLYGYEPYRSNGTISGTYILADLNPGYDGSYPTFFTPLGNQMISGTYNGLFVSDGTINGTTKLSDLSPNFCSGSATFQGKLYFKDFDFSDFNEKIYNTDGTVSGTALFLIFTRIMTLIFLQTLLQQTVQFI